MKIATPIQAAIAAAITLGGAWSAWGQGPAIAYPSNNWSYINHSSTLQEGVLRGQASYIAATGELTYLDSIAAVNYEEANKRAIENSVAWTRAYYEKRELREEFMKKYGPKAFVGEARKKAIESYLPKRLSTEEFAPATGKIVWPHVLRHERYSPIREQIDKAFASRTSENSGDGSASQMQVRQLCEVLLLLMRENIDTITPDQYITAREFVRSVDYEAKMQMTRQNAEPAPEAEAAAPANASGPKT